MHIVVDRSSRPQLALEHFLRRGSSYRSDMALDSIVASEMAPTPPPPMPVDQACCHELARVLRVLEEHT